MTSLTDKFREIFIFLLVFLLHHMLKLNFRIYSEIECENHSGEPLISLLTPGIFYLNGLKVINELSFS